LFDARSASLAQLYCTVFLCWKARHGLATVTTDGGDTWLCLLRLGSRKRKMAFSLTRKKKKKKKKNNNLGVVLLGDTTPCPLLPIQSHVRDAPEVPMIVYASYGREIRSSSDSSYCIHFRDSSKGLITYISVRKRKPLHHSTAQHSYHLNVTIVIWQNPALSFQTILNSGAVGREGKVSRQCTYPCLCTESSTPIRSHLKRNRQISASELRTLRRVYNSRYENNTQRRTFRT
jgi:hypothetical protein